jgi:hypothetical protein
MPAFIYGPVAKRLMYEKYHISEADVEAVVYGADDPAEGADGQEMYTGYDSAGTRRLLVRVLKGSDPPYVYQVREA